MAMSVATRPEIATEPEAQWDFLPLRAGEYHHLGRTMPHVMCLIRASCRARARRTIGTAAALFALSVMYLTDELPKSYLYEFITDNGPKPDVGG